MVELHSRFIVHATCFDIATADDTLIVNITLFNLWLNHGYVLRRLRHFLNCCGRWYTNREPYDNPTTGCIVA